MFHTVFKRNLGLVKIYNKRSSKRKLVNLCVTIQTSLALPISDPASCAFSCAAAMPAEPTILVATPLDAFPLLSPTSNICKYAKSYYDSFKNCNWYYKTETGYSVTHKSKRTFFSPNIVLSKHFTYTAPPCLRIVHLDQTSSWRSLALVLQVSHRPRTVPPAFHSSLSCNKFRFNYQVANARILNQGKQNQLLLIWVKYFNALDIMHFVNPPKIHARFPLFCNDKIPWICHISKVFFLQISRYNFPFFHGAYTPLDSLISLVGGDSDLKSTEPWFSSFERNLPRPQIHWLWSKRIASSQSTIQPHLKSSGGNNWNSHFSRFPLIFPW